MNTHTLITFVGFLISMIDAQYGPNGNLCWSMPCLNGGSCFGTSLVYMCVCPMYYTGSLCEKQLGVCEDNPCGNRGLCIEKSETTYECRCYMGYVGRNCEDQPKVWSTLLPAHTQALFRLFQDAYHRQARGRSFLTSDDDHIDFLKLLITSTISSSSVTTTITTTIAPTTSSIILKKLCSQVLSRVLPEALSNSSQLPISSPTQHRAAKTLLSWLHDHVIRPSTTTTTTSVSIPLTLVVEESTTPSNSLQRLDMHEALNQIDDVAN